ncbi:YybH family protein [Paraburkholderia caribensis]|uniref:YybH family protein n=1 Tax=Paraburkholderia caribensis TaxID=75105 RepID=UPI001CAE787B|nr:SgcJ/EcaC family oxidoreductase [Paraburkholderia caribensis]CAG9261121.1 SnoaL-like domain-containing protein [Paraburkholderia caribensis]
MNADERAINDVLSQYEAALNASDANAVMRLYAGDGVFLPQHFQPGVGTAEIRRTYDSVFSAIQLSVTFEVQEILQLSPFWAIARTRSNGTVKVHATGESKEEANQELFLFQKVEGTWKIARYAFSTTNPATA